MAVASALLRIPLTRLLSVGLFTALLGGGGYVGYRAMRSDIAADVYRQRLEELAGEYESLRTTFNEAVRRTAVTELLVQDGRLSVVIIDAQGQRTTIETILDPSSEIYVDYVVIDGRLLIRRVFDSYTPPMSAIVLDAELEFVDWNDPRAQEGKAVYRALQEGRWIVSATGNGALGLVRLGDVGSTEPVELTPAPPVRDFEEILEELDTSIREIGPGDVWKRVTGSTPETPPN